MSAAATDEAINPLADDCSLYRAVLSAGWVKNGKLKPRVFMRRAPDKEGKPRDVDGLSVALANNRDENKTCTEEAAQFNDCPAVCRIFVGDVRGFGLDAVADKPTHANIIGLPDVPPADIATPEGKQARADAERIGG